MKRQWKDQPKILENGIELFCIFLKGTSVQAVKVDQRYYVTTGNLFGSQTVLVGESEHGVYHALNTVNNRADGKLTKLPKGWQIVENERETD